MYMTISPDDKDKEHTKSDSNCRLVKIKESLFFTRHEFSFKFHAAAFGTETFFKREKEKTRNLRLQLQQQPVDNSFCSFSHFLNRRIFFACSRRGILA
jgi:hypothetical protein